MSRLEKHRKKQFALTIFFFGFIFIVVLIFIFTFGFKLLLNSSLFVADITRQKDSTATNVKNKLIDTAINIDDIPSATNSARIIISGSAPNYEKLLFYINETLVKELKLEKDYFSEEIGSLNDGANTIYVKGYEKDSNSSKDTSTYTVFFKKDKPKLEIKEPSDRQNVNSSDLQIIGLTEKDVNIKVNDLPVVVGIDGNFQTSIRLKEGENKIKVEAEDDAGNIESKELTITYSKE